MSSDADTDRGRRRGRVLIVGAVLLALGGTAYATTHLWLPGTVDLVREAVGFGAMNRLQETVFGVLDDQVEPVEVSAITLDWTTPLRCGATGLQVAHAALDPTRPDVNTTLVRADLTVLRLGLHASGVAPGQAVAAFNGAFQRDHGRFGFRVAGATLVPPVEGAATLGVAEDGQVRLWTWGPGDLAEDWLHLRQNLQMLYDRSRDPAILPALTLVADGRTETVGAAPTRRSGVCLRGDELVYVWSKRATAATLALGMEAAGCERGMHLDSNAFHTRFEFLDGDCAEPASPAMTDGPPGRYFRAQRRDFFSLAPR